MSASDGTLLNVPFEVSDEEREIILDRRSTFVLGRSGTGKTTVLVMKLFQKEQQHQMASEGFNANFDLICGSSWNEPPKNDTFLPQLFVTVNPRLCLAVKEHINSFRRFVRGDNFNGGYISIDRNDMDEHEKFSDIPDSFNDIRSNVYPLVVTLSMFLLMLDKSLGSSYFDRFPDIRKIRSMETTSFRIFAQAVRRKEVTYDKFRTAYWLHFNSEFTKRLDPVRVFTEINSCIKGQLHFEEQGCSKLSLQSYLQLSKSHVSNAEKEMIYKIFEDYEKKKVFRGEFDLSDLVNDLHRRFKYEKYEGKFMDFVYIDEVQDLTMKQLALFKYISNNVEEGFVFAGDTAQTIAKGVDFRFQDIRCLFYKEFLHGKEGMGNKGIVSPISHLSQNFRTHAGVVNLAQSVIDLIYHFFPDSIDKLNPETSLLSGELPVLLDCGTHEDAIIGSFRDRGSLGENGIGFGAEQVIMDVLLYNFFGSSPLKEQWRIIYEYMEKKHCLSSPLKYPELTNARRDVLCYELKQLYVAITRTRQRLWICEDSDGFSSPMAYYWQMLNLIQIKNLDDSFVRYMQVASSSEDWRFRGMKMLEVSNYKAAIQCFEHAKDFYWEKFARASELKAAADNLRGLRLTESLEMLREAANLFESIKRINKAAECGCYELAAEVYADGYYFHECLYACSKGELFHLGLRYIQKWKQQKNLSKPTHAKIDLNASEQKFLHKCAFASHKQQDKQAMMKYVRDFSSLESMRKFLKELGCFDELIDLELENGNLREAANSAKQTGNILLEADILGEAGDYDDASQLYVAFIFASSLWADGGKGWPLKEFPSKNDLLSKAKAYASKCSLHSYKNVCENIQFLSSEEFNLHVLEKMLALSVKHNSIRGEILSVRRILDRFLATEVSIYRKISEKRITVTNLIHYWNCWKEMIEKIFRCLDLFETQGTDGFQDYKNFCLEYLGVRKRPISPNAEYSLLYPDAEWVKYVPRRSYNMKNISAQQLVYAAKKYWCAEILSDGMKLMKLLESFRNIGAKKPMPVHCIFEAAQYLLEKCRFLRRNNDFLSSLMNYLDRSVEEYFGYVFSLDLENKRMLSEGSVLQINALRNLLKEATLQKFMVEIADVEGASPTFPQSIQVAVVLLGSSWQTNEKYEEITSTCIESPWKSLIKILVTKTCLQTSDATMQLVWHLCDSLSKAFNSKCNMSPSCFVYLLDRLLIMVSCFNKCLYATRSSVFEWLVYLNWDVNKDAFPFSDAELSSSVEPVYDFLAQTVHVLLTNKQETQKWVNNARFVSKISFRLLAQKLLILMCLICLNSGKYLELLNEVLTRSDIIRVVPFSFMNILSRRNGSTFLNALAEAVTKINDPLVVIRNAEVCSLWNCIFDVKLFLYKTEFATELMPD
ncbi:TPR and ankyrin repeat-containing protein 1 [Bienertia sinuspersici]